jgi:hypothetical protein
MHRVFDRAENGAIVSRRMVRDKAKADRDRENGGRGGNPQLRCEDNAGVNPTDKAKKLEARDQNQEKQNARASGARYSAEFEDRFWQPYPRTPNMSKLEAWKAWQKSIDNDRPAIVAAVPRYAAWLRQKPDHPVVHACRFITQRRFDGFGEPEQHADMTGTHMGGKVFVAAGSEEASAWQAHALAAGDGLPAGRKGWWLDTRWPPGHPNNGGEDEVCTQTPRTAADA